MAVVVAAVLTGVLAVVLVALVHEVHDSRNAEKKPPPLVAHAADVLRVPVTVGGNPSVPSHYLRLSDGRVVAVNAVTRAWFGATPGDRQAKVIVGSDGKPSSAGWRMVSAGDSFTGFGARFTVLRVWRMPNRDNDAVDLRIDPVGGSEHDY
ncbi:hypothetical protein [Streptomyces sp. NBC_00448]|uniref:hypothetical protein n=1 Tax=Streptomyces sp. NBC_00448 TaxID=2903652 RepID=UPI002E245D97